MTNLSYSNWLKPLFDRLRGRKTITEYNTWLAQFGRVTEGYVTDFQQDDAGTTIFYRYNIANVDYETSQQLNGEQAVRNHTYLPGASITVRYDPKNPGSSIVP